MRVIGVDSSGIVEQPPVFIVAARLRFRNGRIEYNSQKHHIIRLDTEPHNTFVGVAREWRLKLSALLIYSVVIRLIDAADVIEIDIDFNPSAKKKVRRYLKRLFFNYYRETAIGDPPIYFKSVEESQYIQIADSKSKQARRREIGPIEDASEKELNKLFNVLRNIT